MEPIIKETQVIRDHDGGWDRNTSSRSKWALGLGIFGAAAGGLALAKQGGIYGVAIASRNGSEYLRSLPDGSDSNNLGDLPSISMDLH